MSMMQAIRIHRNGGPEEMLAEQVPRPTCGAGEVLVRHSAIGVNFSDINVRRGGFYDSILKNSGHGFPLILGNEAAGRVIGVAAGVTDFAEGDRVAYAGLRGQFFEQCGAYCEIRALPADRLVHLPDHVTDDQAAACLLKGSTASLMINRLRRPGPGDIVLVNTAASGVGSLLCQWSRHLGATVIGTVGRPDKAPLGQENGCHHVLSYKSPDFEDQVRRLAPGGIDIVYDGVGEATFHRSIPLMAPFGTMVNYGNASGPVPPLDIQRLAMRSLSVARAGVTGHIGEAEDLRRAASELFDLVGKGVLRPRIHRRFPLADAVQAHVEVETGRAAGSILLIP